MWFLIGLILGLASVFVLLHIVATPATAARLGAWLYRVRAKRQRKKADRAAKKYIENIRRGNAF